MYGHKYCIDLICGHGKKSYSSLNDSTQHLRAISKEYILLAIIALQKTMMNFLRGDSFVFNK
jgi:hypothetical protein